MRPREGARREPPHLRARSTADTAACEHCAAALPFPIFRSARTTSTIFWGPAASPASRFETPDRIRICDQFVGGVRECSLMRDVVRDSAQDRPALQLRSAPLTMAGQGPRPGKRTRHISDPVTRERVKQVRKDMGRDLKSRDTLVCGCCRVGVASVIGASSTSSCGSKGSRTRWRALAIRERARPLRPALGRRQRRPRALGRRGRAKRNLWLGVLHARGWSGRGDAHRRSGALWLPAIRCRGR